MTLAGWHDTPKVISPAWSQAHGHTQIFGWLGTTVLALAFYWFWTLRRVAGPARGERTAKLVWVLWTAGLALRWWTAIAVLDWKLFLPLSAVLELLAFGVTLGLLWMRRREWYSAQLSIWLLVGGGFGCAVALVINFVETLKLALAGAGSIFPADLDRRLLLVCTWGFLCPVAWGLSAKWLPGALGLKPTKTKILAAAGILDAIGIVAAIFGTVHLAAVLLLHAAIFVPSSLKVFGKRIAPGEVGNPVFVRLAFAWLRVGATLGVWASVHDAAGIWGASRHSLTVGFLSSLVFVLLYQVGPRLCGVPLASRMLQPGSLGGIASISLILLNSGCLLQVVSLIVAYQGYGRWAWTTLPVASILEVAAFALFIFQLATALTLRRTVEFAAATVPND